MAKQEPIKQEGEILEALPNAQFRVKLENGTRYWRMFPVK